jgi:2-dehydro-3-deoxyphosphogluconate aldolase / (4S)-4-hydroxy-2-oxoglutarate aldolase
LHQYPHDILRLDDLSQARQIAEVLIRAGVQAFEFTLTNPSAPKVIESLRASNAEIQLGKAIIGLGSVRSLEEAKIAVDCGAQFVVSPITSIPIIDFCKNQGVAVFPGAYTPTEIDTAWNAGADMIKVFPARNLGPGYLRDVLAPMPYLKLMPTGGVDLSNIASYFQAGATAVGIGSQLFDPLLIQTGDWPAIESTARQYVNACKEAV